MFPFLGSPFLTSSLTSLSFISSRPIRDIPRGSKDPDPDSLLGLRASSSVDQTTELALSPTTKLTPAYRFLFGNSDPFARPITGPSDDLTNLHPTLSPSILTNPLLSPSLLSVSSRGSKDPDPFAVPSPKSPYDLTTYNPRLSPSNDLYDPILVDGFSYSTFISNLPFRFRHNPNFDLPAIFAAFRGRPLSGGGTYADGHSSFLSTTNSIESFVVFLLYTSKSAIYVGLPFCGY